MGAALHYIVIAPLLTAPPINQLLATGGVLFILQSFATVAFGIDFRNLGIRLPVLAFGEMHFSYARLLSFAAALIGMVSVYLFMTRTYTGTAIRAIAQDRQIMPLMGVDTKRIYLITSALGGALAGLAACLLVLQYDVHPFVGLSFGPITFLICVLGGLGNFVGGFIAAFVFAEIISLGGLFSDLEWGYVLAFAFFIVMMFIRPAGPVGEAPVNRAIRSPGRSAIAALIALPFVYRDPYHLHILVLILIWSFAYTSWSIMGRFGLVSLGHGGFMGVGAYVTALLWNHLGVSPWIGIPVEHAGGGGAGAGGGLSLFPLPHHRALFRAGDAGAVRHRAAGHHRDPRLHRRFARLYAEPDQGQPVAGAAVRRQDHLVPDRAVRLAAGPVDLALGRPQHEPLRHGGDFGGRRRRRRGRRQRHRRKAQDHADQRADDGARRRAVLPVPDVHLARHRQRHFGVAADGFCRHRRRRSMFRSGPTVGAIITILLAEILRIGFGTRAVGWDNLVYGVLLVLFIIFLPKGILGSVLDETERRNSKACRRRS